MRLLKRLLKITIITIMFTLLVFPYFYHFQAEAASKHDYLKVGLKFGGNAVESCILKSDEGFILGTAEDRRFEEGMPLPSYSEITVTNESGNIVIRDEDGVLLSSDLGTSGCIMPADYDDGGIIYLDGTPYRDGIQLLPKSNGKMTVINYVRLEHYVYGVLNNELGHTNPKEALKAQAVAARSFAELNRGTHSADGFDLCNTTHCQVYNGYSCEYDSTNEATDETEGEMIRYDGEPVAAYYYKNSGGYTQNSEDVWTSSIPHLRAVKDEYSPDYPWSTSLSFDIIRTKLESAGFTPGEVQSVAISGSNSNGSVTELKIEGSKATVYLKKEKIRTVLGATIIKSNRFTLGEGEPLDYPSFVFFISNGRKSVESDDNTYVINGLGKMKELDGDPFYVTNGFSTIQIGDSQSSKPVTDGVVYFNGYGYGHGVGMPQDSAVEMAREGYSYDEILEYFYTDIEIE